MKNGDKRFLNGIPDHVKQEQKLIECMQ